MTNEEGLNYIRSGRESFHKWREHNPERFDVTREDFNNRDFGGWNLTQINFNSTNFAGANLSRANLSESVLFHSNLISADLTSATCERTTFRATALKGATLSKVDFRFARIEPVNPVERLVFEHCDLSHADLSQVDFRESRFLACNLEGTVCNATDLRNALFDSSSCVEINLAGAHLEGASCRNVNFCRANLQFANLSSADVAGADFLDATLTRAQLRNIRNAHRAINLENTFAPEEPTLQPQWFETAERRWLEKWCDWEMIKSAGRMQLFGASYFLMVYLVTSFYVIGQYNDKLEAIQAWAQLKRADGNIATRPLADKLLALSPFPISKPSVLLLVSTLLLIGASVVYALGCPAKIKEFSSTEWRYAHGRSLVHYWPHSWRQPRVRIFCAMLYAIGALLFVPIALSKVVAAMIYAWEYGQWTL